jgi:histone chaperone ASF1
VLDNPAPFTAPIRFEITFDSFADQLKEELEWKVIYVGSAQDERYDQVLDSVLVGPVKKGRSRFILEVDAPNYSLIPNNEMLEVTVILLTCSYKGNEFVRIGYYVNNELQGVAADTPVENIQVDVNNIIRNILLDTPVVTRYDIAWDDSSDADALKSFMQQNSKLEEEIEEDDVDMDENEEDEEEEEVRDEQGQIQDEEEEEEDEEDDDGEEEEEASEIDLEEEEDIDEEDGDQEEEEQ